MVYAWEWQDEITFEYGVVIADDEQQAKEKVVATMEFDGALTLYPIENDVVSVGYFILPTFIENNEDK